MNIEKAIAAALEPIAADLISLERKVDAVQLITGSKGDKGDKGDAADPAVVAELLAEDTDFRDALRGANGADGVGLLAPQWIAGDVYRAGTTVVAYMGQHFYALKDTASAPAESPHWRRVGSGGFRHRGAYDKDAKYIDGDLFVKDFGTFAVVNGGPLLLAGRGAAGKQGESGKKGDAGDNGRNGTTIIGAQVQGFKLVLVQQDGDGAIDHLEADFAPAFNELLRDAMAAALPELMATVADLRDEVAALKRAPPARRLHA